MSRNIEAGRINRKSIKPKERWPAAANISLAKIPDRETVQTNRPEQALRSPRYPIVYVTDFGDQTAVAECKTFLAKTVRAHNTLYQEPLAVISDVKFPNIVHGAFNIDRLAQNLAEIPTIFVGVCDPGVGTKREGVVIRTTNDHVYIGPNNGLFWKSASREGIVSVDKIKDDIFEKASVTFHGRDVFTPLAGLITAGADYSNWIESLPIEKLIQLDFADNQVFHVDGYGELKANTKIPRQKLVDGEVIDEKPTHVRLKSVIKKPSNDRRGWTVVDKDILIPIHRTYEDVEPGEVLALESSSDWAFEIAVRNASVSENSAARLGIAPGDILDLEWQTNGVAWTAENIITFKDDGSRNGTHRRGGEKLASEPAAPIYTDEEVTQFYRQFIGPQSLETSERGENRRSGVTMFIDGLTGAGKTTVQKILAERNPNLRVLLETVDPIPEPYRDASDDQSPQGQIEAQAWWLAQYLKKYEQLKNIDPSEDVLVDRGILGLFPYSYLLDPSGELTHRIIRLAASNNWVQGEYVVLVARDDVIRKRLEGSTGPNYLPPGGWDDERGEFIRGLSPVVIDIARRAGARIIDTSDLTPEQVADKVEEIYNSLNRSK